MKAPEEVAPLKELGIFKLNELVEQLMLLDYFIPVIKSKYTVEENNPWGE